MTIVEATRSCLGKYVQFSGRATRAEFWKFVLAVFLALVLATIVNSVLFGPENTTSITMTREADGSITQGISYQTSYDGGIFGDILSVLVALPLFAVLWRRMHDIGRPGWHGAVLWVCSLTLTGFSVLGFQVESATTTELQTSFGGLPEVIMDTTPPMILRVAEFISWTVTLPLSIYWLTKKSVTEGAIA